jgi:hypothetical protein
MAEVQIQESALLLKAAIAFVAGDNSTEWQHRIEVKAYY